MAKHPVTVKYIDEIKKAMKMFGEYSYYDKGASDVMMIDPKPFLKLKQKERLQVAKEMMAYKHGEPFCMELSSLIYYSKPKKNELSEKEYEELTEILEPE